MKDLRSAVATLSLIVAVSTCVLLTIYGSLRSIILPLYAREFNTEVDVVAWIITAIIQMTAVLFYYAVFAEKSNSTKEKILTDFNDSAFFLVISFPVLCVVGFVFLHIAFSVINRTLNNGEAGIRDVLFMSSFVFGNILIAYNTTVRKDGI